MAETAAAGMSENIAGLLCYVLGWVTGLIFYLIDKRPFVRFHAAQSMVVFGGLHIIYYVLGRLVFAAFWTAGYGLFSFAGLVLEIIDLLAFVLWIVLMVKAYQGERFKVPVAGELAENIAGR